MNIILDTHIFLWAIGAPERLIARHRRLLESPRHTVFFSAVSMTEMMIKASLGKLSINFDPLEIAERSGFEVLEFSAADALPLQALPFHHRDPFDRMLISQSLARGYHLMSRDVAFRQYPCALA